jgi:hypothetical protein
MRAKQKSQAEFFIKWATVFDVYIKMHPVEFTNATVDVRVITDVFESFSSKWNYCSTSSKNDVET